MLQNCIASCTQSSVAPAGGYALASNRDARPIDHASFAAAPAPVSLPGVKHLTAREKEVLYWFSRGKTDWQMAQILEISAKTVNFHVERVKAKLDAATRAHATEIALRAGLLTEAVAGYCGQPAGLPEA